MIRAIYVENSPWQRSECSTCCCLCLRDNDYVCFPGCFHDKGRETAAMLDLGQAMAMPGNAGPV